MRYCCSAVITHPHLRNPNGLAPGQEMLRCQTGRACPRGLKPHAISHIVHDDEDVAVTPVLIQVIVTQPPTCSKLEIVEVDDFARPSAVHGLHKRTRHLLPRFRVHAMDTLFDELGDVFLHAKPTAVFRQPLEGSHGTTMVSLLHVSHTINHTLSFLVPPGIQSNARPLPWSRKSSSSSRVT